MSRIHQHLTSTLVAKVMIAGITVLQGALLSRLLGPEGRGLFSKMQVSINFFILFLGLGLTSTIVYYFANKKIAPTRVMGLSIGVSAFGVGALVLISMLVSLFPQFDFIFPTGFHQPFLVGYLVFSFALSQFQLLASSALRAQLHFDVHNSLEVGTGLLRLFALLGLFLVRDASWATWQLVFVVDLAANLIRLNYYLWAYGKHVRVWPQFRFDWKNEVKPMIQFTGLLYFSFLLSFLYTRIDVWIVEKEAGLAQLGVYSVAFSLAQVINFLPFTLNSVLFPHLANSNSQEDVHTLRHFSRVNFTALILLGMAICILAEPLVLVLYGQDFISAVLPIRILTWAMVLMSVKHLFAYYNLAKGNVRVNFYAEGAALVLAVFLNLKLVPSLGVVGAAWASVGANGLACAIVFFQVVRKSKLSQWQFFVMGPSDFSLLLENLSGWLRARYIVRLDDACPTYRKAAWDRIERMCDKYGVKPIVGVIPENRDKSLMFQEPDPDFWPRVRRWRDKGWTIAMHGCHHELDEVGYDGSLVPLHSRSEFSTRPIDQQREQIREAWRIFQREGLEPTMWMAPAHTFDRTTLQALKDETPVRLITDGLGLQPFQRDGFVWLPQQSWSLKPRLFGVWTCCLHPNTMTEEEITGLEVKMARLKEKFVVDIQSVEAEFKLRSRSFLDATFARFFFLKRRVAQRIWR